MNLVTIASKSLKQRALSSSLTALSVALGVTLMVSVLVINGIIERSFNQTGAGFDLVVGPKGSPLELVLSTVFHIGNSGEPLPYLYYEQLKKDDRIERAIPFAMGDVTQEGAFRIVGTTPQFFEVEYLPERPFRVRGRFIDRPFDSVVGAQVARQNGWDVGTEFQVVHGGASGHTHDEKFTVVGVLAPTGTPNDKVVFINLEGFYLVAGHEKPIEEAIARLKAFNLLPPNYKPPKPHVHEHDHGHDHGHDHAHEVPSEQKEVSSILVLSKFPTMSPRLLAEINEGPVAQAASPTQEISWLLRNVVGNVRMLLVVLTALIIVVSGVGIFVSIYNSMSDRRREIAIMRALGAHRGTVFSIILAESVLLCLAGGVLGLLLGHGLVFIAAPLVEARAGILIDPWAFEPLELVLLPVLFVLAALIGVVPGLTAYRNDVARNLAG